ncbi:MAG: O-antigen ligase family protein [Limisphaerales bacterium]
MKSADTAREDARPTGKVKDARSLSLRIILFIAAGMMAVGLLFSYSRGAWFGTAIGLLYLIKAHRKLKWWYVVTGFGLLALGILLIWGRTPDNAPWYLKRLDLSRPSAQHRVAAWKTGFEIMWDHPFGVGWNKVMEIYEEYYSPPKNGAGAIATNDYLMLGTQLGIPSLLCFVAYVALRLRSSKSKVQSPKSFKKEEERMQNEEVPKAENAKKSAREDTRPAILDIGRVTLDSTQTACRAGAVTLLVAFWFDGGLFNLPTAAVFWILLELGSVQYQRTTLKDIAHK